MTIVRVFGARDGKDGAELFAKENDKKIRVAQAAEATVEFEDLLSSCTLYQTIFKAQTLQKTYKR